MHLEDSTDTSKLKVKLLSGASVVKIKPVFSYDSKCLMVASGSDVKVYNIQSGICLHTLRHHKKQIVSLHENKNNSVQVFTCSEDGIVVRWDYAEGIKLQVYDLQFQVASFYTPSVSNSWFATKRMDNSDEYRLYSFTPKSSKVTGIKMVLHPVEPRENAIAFGTESYSGENKDLILSYLESDHFLLTKQDVALESFSLPCSKACLTGVAKTDSLLMSCRLQDGNVRRFRIQFDSLDDIDGVENRKHCTGMLRKYITIFDYDEENDRHVNRSELAKIDECLLDKMKCRKGYSVMIPKENTKEILTLCLTDNTFPAFVAEIDKLLKEIGKM